MKKLLVALLALAVIGGVSAQVTWGTYAHGQVTLLDQDMNGVFTQNNWAADTITFKGANADKTLSFDATLTDQLTDLDGALRNWTAAYTIFDGAATVSVGKLRNGTFRMGDIAGDLRFTARISGYNLLTTVKVMDGMTVGVNLPYGTTAMAMADVLQSTDIGLAYTIADVGKVILLANLDLVASSNVINFGFNFTGVENLGATLVAQATLATATTYWFNAGVSYAVSDALSVWFYADYDGADYLAKVNADYALNDMVSFNVNASYGSADGVGVAASATYAFGNGLAANLNVGYAADVTYDLDVTYEISL